MRRQPKKFGGQKREGQENRRNGPSGLFTTHAAHPGSASVLPSGPLPSQQVRVLQVWLQPVSMYIPLPSLTSSFLSSHLPRLLGHLALLYLCHLSELSPVSLWTPFCISFPELL